MPTSTIKHKGFTLIELLVVIAIIAILAAILFPSFAKAREKAKQTTCTSNLKQMGMAIAAYCQDYDEFMPLSSASASDPASGYDYMWMTEIHPYLAGCAWDGGGTHTSKVLFCPADTDEILLNTKNNAWKGNKITNYMYHAWLGHIVYASSFATYRPRTLARCFAPSTCAIMIDGKCKNRQPIFDIQVPSNATSYIADRHSGGTNVLYADNHVSWFNLASASQEEITRIFMWNNKKDWRY